MKFINKLTGTEMWVADDRVDEYKAAGHVPAVMNEPVEAEKPTEEKPVETEKPTEEKPVEAKKPGRKTKRG